VIRLRFKPIEYASALLMPIPVDAEHKQLDGWRFDQNFFDVFPLLDGLPTADLGTMDPYIGLRLAQVFEHRFEDRLEDEVIVLVILGDDPDVHARALDLRRTG
jgi:hypothetical protein